MSILAVLARSGGKCTVAKPPLAYQQIIDGLPAWVTLSWLAPGTTQAAPLHLGSHTQTGREIPWAVPWVIPYGVSPRRSRQ